MKREEIDRWRQENPEIQHVLAGLCDISGTWRGKRVPIDQIDRLIEGRMRLPLSIPGVDVWGQDPENSKLVFEEGDRDGICRHTGRGVLYQDWTKGPSALFPVWLFDEDGEPFMGDPRQVLAAVIERYTKRGLRPVTALEMEFYIYEAKTLPPRPPKMPNRKSRLDETNVLALDELEAFDGFFNDVYEACRTQDIALEAAISENGYGQFEINFIHIEDPLRAADDAALFKRVVKGVATNHGLGASFMAKPYGDASGSGMHMHFSILDEKGMNIFDDGTDEGSELLHHAVGGLMDTMAEMTLIFAPHLNSYKRLTPRAHAPTEIAWGYDNRTAAIRIPGGQNKSRRIEHRVAGSDANPYLVMAAVLGGALHGIESKITPPAPVESVVDGDGEMLPFTWESAIEAFSKGKHVKQILSKQMRSLILDIKEQEVNRFNSEISEFEYQSYLETL